MAKKKFTQSGTQTYSGSTPLAEKLINYIMKDGKKNIARKIYYDMLKEVKKQWHMNPQIVVENAVANASPSVMIKSKRVGWSIYQVPVEVKPWRRLFFACKWILDSARSKSWKPMSLCLADEMLAAYAEQWYAVKKKEDAHKMAEANKAYAYMAKYMN